jgi:hypothetical protein
MAAASRLGGVVPLPSKHLCPATLDVHLQQRPPMLEWEGPVPRGGDALAVREVICLKRIYNF